jgi:hypothetical protein
MVQVVDSKAWDFFSMNLSSKDTFICSTLHVEFLNKTIFKTQNTKISTLRYSNWGNLKILEPLFLLNVNFWYGMICIAPEEWLLGVTMTS